MHIVLASLYKNRGPTYNGVIPLLVSMAISANVLIQNDIKYTFEEIVTQENKNKMQQLQWNMCDKYNVQWEMMLKKSFYKKKLLKSTLSND